MIVATENENSITFYETVSEVEVKNYVPNSFEKDMEWRDQDTVDILQNEDILSIDNVNKFVAWVGNKAKDLFIMKNYPEIKVNNVESLGFDHTILKARPRVKFGEKIFVTYEKIDDLKIKIGRITFDLSIESQTQGVPLKLTHNLNIS